MPRDVVKALVPTAAAASLLSQEFPLSDLVIDGTLCTVLIYAATYSDAVVRIRAWMSRTHLGPVLVTDDTEHLVLGPKVTLVEPRTRRQYRA